jgi:hypothetical protein
MFELLLGVFIHRVCNVDACLAKKLLIFRRQLTSANSCCRVRLERYLSKRIFLPRRCGHSFHFIFLMLSRICLIADRARAVYPHQLLLQFFLLSLLLLLL